MQQQTSLLAFEAIRGHLGPRQAEVFEVIEQFGPMDNKQIAAKLGWSINQVTPRCLELRRKGKVEKAWVDVDATGRRVTFWRAS